MDDGKKETVICPDVELLTRIETNIPCSVPRCSKILPNTSSLRMHLIKTHNVVTEQNQNIFEKDSGVNKTQTGKKKTFTLYCCPVDGCVRGKNASRPFSRLAHVKQHYMTIHGDKKYVCSICGKKFGRNDACLRHEKTCGKVFNCSCGCPFNSRTSLLNHTRRTGHVLPQDDKNQETLPTTTTGTSFKISPCSPNAVQGQPVCFSFIPVTSKKMPHLRPLKPKKLLVNSMSQTDVTCVCHAGTMTKQVIQNDNSSQFDITTPRSIAVGTCEYTQTISDNYNNAKSQITDTGTRTMDEAYTQTIGAQFCLESNCQTTDGVFTQTIDEGCFNNAKRMDEAYTQTAGHTSESNCQTIEKVYAQTMDEAFTQTSFIADENFPVDFTIDNEEFKELTNSQTQTSWGLAFEGFPLFEDNETQTLESYLDSFDPANITSDCATQTKNIFHDIFSVDTETQTLLPLINLTDHCQQTADHSDQTLESIYLDSHS